jgi:hypothetical protein
MPRALAAPARRLLEETRRALRIYGSDIEEARLLDLNNHSYEEGYRPERVADWDHLPLPEELVDSEVDVRTRWRDQDPRWHTRQHFIQPRNAGDPYFANMSDDETIGFDQVDYWRPNYSAVLWNDARQLAPDRPEVTAPRAIFPRGYEPLTLIDYFDAQTISQPDREAMQTRQELHALLRSLRAALDQPPMDYDAVNMATFTRRRREMGD